MMTRLHHHLLPVAVLLALSSCRSTAAFAAPTTRQANNAASHHLLLYPHRPNSRQDIVAFAARSSSSAINVARNTKKGGAPKKSKEKEKKEIKNEKMEKKKVMMPESELINRRKSPALWRYDLSTNVDTTADAATNNNDSTNPKKWYPPTPPEIMSPAGGFPQLSAAITNGASSIYLGCSAFSARARATNFDVVSELPHAVQLAHESGVKVYVALNTLVFTPELVEVAELIHQIDGAGVDAVIVQDLGICKLLREIAPRLELHASTQMSATGADGVRHARRLGASRVVLGRELSVKEIEMVGRDVRGDDTSPTSSITYVNSNDGEHNDEDNSSGGEVEIEAFVHGALCVSYSGQCFSSEAWGGRSANRGQCAQACRLPYGLVTDGVLTNLGDLEYLLSPQDLCGLEQVPELVRAGVSCLKIEGRLKQPDYVAATTRAYRNAVNEAWEDIQQERFEAGDIDEAEMQRMIALNDKRILSSEEVVTKSELTQLFSRGQDEENDGLSPGFFEGPQHQRLVRGRSPRHRGVHVGRAVGAESTPRNGIVIASKNEDVLRSLKRGDGLVIDRGSAQEKELGGPIYSVSEIWQDFDSSGEATYSLEIKFGRDVMKHWSEHDGPIRKRQDKSSSGDRKLLVPDNAHVWRTSDAAVDKKIRRLVEADPPRSLVRVSVAGKVGEPLSVIIESTDGQRRGTGQSEGPLEAAEGAGLAPDKVRKAVGKLGDTEYGVDGEIDVSSLDDGLWCPVSWIKEARRNAIEAFEDSATKESSEDAKVKDTAAVNPAQVVANLMKEVSEVSSESKESGSIEPTTRLSILARSYEQVDRICRMAEEGEPIDEVIIDFLEVNGMKDAVARIREVESIQAIVASPRVIKPGECGIWRTLLRLEPDGLLLRSAGLLHRMNSLGGEGATVNLASKSRDEEDCLVQIPKLIGDFSLNVANVITAGELLLSEGLTRISAAYDLNANAITELAELMGPANAARLDVIAHSHLPIFHTEHCVFARFLSEGNSYVDCGHACTRHTVHLRDQTGADNLVLADMGCRNTVFTAQAQSGVHSIKEWCDDGIGRLRIELVDENADDTESIIYAYIGVLSGDIRPREAWEDLKHIRDSNGREGGVSHGSLRNGVERRAGEITKERFLEDVY